MFDIMLQAFAKTYFGGAGSIKINADTKTIQVKKGDQVLHSLTFEQVEAFVNNKIGPGKQNIPDTAEIVNPG